MRVFDRCHGASYKQYVGRDFPIESAAGGLSAAANGLQCYLSVFKRGIHSSESSGKGHALPISSKKEGMFPMLAVKTARTQDTRLHLARFVGEAKRVVPLTIIAVGRQYKA